MTMVTVGPSGGEGGQDFNDCTMPTGATLNEIHVFADRYIDALQLIYTDASGQTVTTPRVGGLGGEQYVFALDDDEYLTGISGRTDWYVDQLRFYTNKRTSDTYGGEMGQQDFRLEAAPDSEIVGFFGRSDWYIDAIGIVTRERVTTAETATPTPKKPTPPPPSNGDPQPKNLQKVEGIGPKISALLIDNGILDLNDLAQADPVHIKEILVGAGRRYAIADPTTWPEQAALGAKGEWDALKALQEELKGGRRK